MASDLKDRIILENIDTKKLAESIKRASSQSTNEEEIKMAIEKLIDPIIKTWEIRASYEHKTRHEISGARKDALYGHVIIEYKSPGKLDSKMEFGKAKEQLKGYIKKEAVDEKYFGRWFGVIIDGSKIGFVRWKRNEWEEQDEALDVSPQTILRLLEAIRGLKRKAVDAESLLLDFGPKSELSKKMIKTLYETLKKSKTPRTIMLFEDWKRVFSQVVSYSPEKLVGLTQYYDLTDVKDADLEKLLFAIHTYYTLLMKLLTSEIVTIFADSLLGSYLKKLEEAYLKSDKELLNELRGIEEGGIFNTLGIKNFLEADYFAWYIDDWNKNIADTVVEVVKALSDYEPATVELNPERVKDLFKRLYQNLVPRDIRHRLGEYFTPDWLAELLLDEVGYDGNPDKKILDPSCGSGTFLVLAIKRIRGYARDNFLDERELVKKIIQNVRGIDLNPLAVLASKANFLIALSDLLRYRPSEGIDIPIYLADSISVERTITLTGESEFTLHTTEGKFWVTKEVIDKGLLYPVLSLIDQCAKNRYSQEEFGRLLGRQITLAKSSVSSLGRLYKKIYDLEYKYHKNRIWTSLLRNSFAPLLMGKFDYVIGNPPWINWENLPEFYRNNTKHLWSDYGLLEKTEGMGLGKVKRDMSMLFVAKCLNQYVFNGGKLAFLIPFTCYKTQAGAGFRKFLAYGMDYEDSDKIFSKVLKIHDLVTLYPFEGAVNRTSMIILQKVGKTQFPINCTMWSNPRSKGMDMEAELNEVKKTTKQFDMILAPIRKTKPETSWMIVSKGVYDVLQRIMKPSEYRAYAGVYTGLNSAYWIKIFDKQSNGIFIKNLADIGKKNIQEIKSVIENDLLYPLVRGRNVKKWYSYPSLHIIIPHDSRTGNPIKEAEMKNLYPKTYSYFLKIRNHLEKRQIHKLWGKDNPFYSLYDIGSYSFAPYKVCWKVIAGKISGKGEFSTAVVEPTDDKILGPKIGITDIKLILIPFKNKDEAHYVSSLLNSSFAYVIVASHVIETGISTHVLKHMNILKFNRKNKIHLKLSELSKRAHELAKKYYEKDDTSAKYELTKVEEEIDKTVAKLYGITDEELGEIKKTLRILKGGGADEKITELPVSPKI